LVRAFLLPEIPRLPILVGGFFAFPEQFWNQLTGEIMSVMAISRKQVKQASQNLGQVLKAQADYVVQALEELLTNKGDKSELRSIVIAGVQNIKVRDFILCHIATHESQQELIEVLAETALKAPEKDCEQVAAMVAILLKANDADVSRIRKFIDLGNELSLAQLVEIAVKHNVPAKLARDSILAVLDTCTAELESTVSA
jgi:protein involved in ribonucleotide reduction